MEKADRRRNVRSQDLVMEDVQVRWWTGMLIPLQALIPKNETGRGGKDCFYGG